MLTLGKIKELLKDRRLQVVAQATGLHYNTLLEIRDDPTANPSYRTILALSNYLQQSIGGASDAT